jgi:O-glycosyl hydrolase
VHPLRRVRQANAHPADRVRLSLERLEDRDLPSLVLAFDFGEAGGTTALDASGNGNAGTISGAARTAAGKYGGALSFDGSSSWVTVPATNSLNLTAGMTLEAWVQPAAASTGWATALLKERPGGLAYALYAADGAGRPPAGYINRNGADVDAAGSSALPLNSWSHLAATYDGAILRLYINGTQVHSRSQTGNIATSTGPLRIGGNGIWGEHFSGLIDEVRVYDTALTQTQIQTDMNSPVAAESNAHGVPLTIDGAQTFQTIDGFGVNVNAHSWNDGEVRPALDLLHDRMGATLFRVAYDMEDWESTNDNADPDTPDWAYYNSLYSNASFQELWGTLHYLNQKGVRDGITLSLMGRVPDWMGGSAIDTAFEDEWVETVATLVSYARNTEHVQFGILDPLNEPDWDGIEGPQVDAAQYTHLLHKLSERLDAMGLGDVRFLGPSTASVDTGVNTYMPTLMTDPVVMNKRDHFAFHNYAGDTAGADAAIKASAYPTKDFWISEVTNPWDIMTHIGGNPSAVMVWEGYDSAYIHPTLHGAGTDPPNDAGNGPAPLAYDAASGTYSPRKSFYQDEQIFKYVPRGSVRVGAEETGGDLTVYAFYDPASGRVTIVGENQGTAAIAVAGSLSNLPAADRFQYFATDSDSDFLPLAEVSVNNGSFAFTAPANSFFTLTALTASDVTPPSVWLTAPGDRSLDAGTVPVSAAASDNEGVAGVQFLLNGQPLGVEDTTSPYSVSWDTTAFANGDYSLSARARDTAGNTTTSAAITVTVSNSAPTGLVAAYGFNEGAGTTTADASANGLTGTLSNASWSTAGRYGGALSFNGSNAWVTVADNNLLDLASAMTLEAWVKPAALSGWKTALIKERPGGLAYSLYASDDTSRPPAGYINRNGTDVSVLGTTALTLNAWAHLAVTYDASTLRLYVNGTEVASRSQTGNITTSTGALRIGGNAVWGEYFSGLIDEVRIYNRALSAAEIQTDMTTPIGSPEHLLGEEVPAADAMPLSRQQVGPLFDEAATCWAAALGGDATALQRLWGVRVEVLDLPGTTLGLASGTMIYLDANAAGRGWFVDPTPWEDSEFAPGVADSPAAGRVDLLTVLAHEMGHILGRDDDHETDPKTGNVMADVLPLGVRRIHLDGLVPEAADVPLALVTSADLCPASEPGRWPAFIATSHRHDTSAEPEQWSLRGRFPDALMQ